MDDLNLDLDSSRISSSSSTSTHVRNHGNPGNHTPKAIVKGLSVSMTSGSSGSTANHHPQTQYESGVPDVSDKDADPSYSYSYPFSLTSPLTSPVGPQSQYTPPYTIGSDGVDDEHGANTDSTISTSTSTSTDERTPSPSPRLSTGRTSPRSSQSHSQSHSHSHSRRSTSNSTSTTPQGNNSNENGNGKTSICTLKFDNTYAKLHTKKLSWSARVVEVEEYVLIFVGVRGLISCMFSYGYFFILLLSCSLSSGALDSPDLLVPYSIITITPSLHNTIVLIITHLSIFQSFNISIFQSFNP